MRNIVLFQNALVITGTNYYFDTAFGEAAPAHLIVEGANEWMSARPKKNDASVVRLWLVLQPCLDLSAPKFSLVLGPLGKIDNVVNR